MKNVIPEVDSKSMDIVADNISKLKELFPEAFTEGKVDFDALKEVLGNYIDGREERYSFTWNGKSKARMLAQTPSTGTLRPCEKESVDWDTTQNLFIEGDNLEVLKLLQKSYHKKVKMIYIDPPYNTGGDLIYEDNFKDSIKNYKEITGQVDCEGRNLSSNPETSGRYHTDWLNMMYPRLKAARNLLSDDGVLFVSIDDNEVHNLQKICDEIFGDENFINKISIKAKPSSGASGGGEDIKLKKNIEYLICYCKSKHLFGRFNEVYDEKNLISYINEYREEGKSWKYTRVITSLGTREFYKEIKDGSGETIKIYKHENVGIVTLKDLAKDENLDEEKVYLKYFDRIFRDTNAQSSIRQRVIDATDNDDTFYSIEYYPISGRNKGTLTTLYYKGRNKDLIAWLSDVASKENGTLLKKEKVGTLWDSFNWNNVSKEGNIQYPNGKKPISFIQRMIRLCSGDDKNDIILDFFAGSGSTAHAVMAENLTDNGQRKSISIQLPELISDKDKKVCYSSPDLNHLNTIADISKERIRRAASKIKEENPDYQGDLGFKVFKLDSTNIKPWELDFDLTEQDLEDQISNVKHGREDVDVLYEVLLKYGLDLTLPITEHSVAGQKVFDIGMGALMICLSDDITLDVVEGIATLKDELKPEIMRVVFKDAGFANDVVKTNAVQILKQAGIEDVRSL